MKVISTQSFIIISFISHKNGTKNWSFRNIYLKCNIILYRTIYIWNFLGSYLFKKQFNLATSLLPICCPLSYYRWVSNRPHWVPILERNFVQIQQLNSGHPTPLSHTSWQQILPGFVLILRSFFIDEVHICTFVVNANIQFRCI